MILVITGNGKGKTTSALGTALRALGWGKKVGIVFFDKGGSHYGEQNIFEFLQEKKSNSRFKFEDSKLNLFNIEIFRFGLERFSAQSKTFRFENTYNDKEEASLALEKVHTLYKDNYFLIVCDEIINCMNLDLIDELSVQNLINQCPSNTHLVLTGRNAPDWLIEKADLVSDVQEIKHYFKNGQDAIEGIDY
ncbi:cob(I)yrinic acid a,c-diamide adenosyltransferase [Candidatus Peregrinibacteria bacterium]|nr:cob(I)yrinic acid a,c-diamide adenosyltransferase [Candidatus Peregrinibacteria bacterium]